MSASNPKPMETGLRIPAAGPPAGPSASDAPAVRAGLSPARSSDLANARGFEELVEAHAQRITRLAHSLLGWRHEVDDVVQDVFAQAWQSAARFRGESLPGTWLTRIAINVCRARLRRERVWRGLRIWLRPADAEAAPPSNTGLDAGERAARVRAAVAELPEGLREVVVLHYLEGLSIDDVAAVAGVSRGAADTRLTRARAKLHAALGDLWEGRA